MSWARPSGGLVAVNSTAPLSGMGTSGSPLVIAAATDSAPGSFSAADKTKLDAISTVWPPPWPERLTFAVNPGSTRAVSGTLLKSIRDSAGQNNLVAQGTAPSFTPVGGVSAILFGGSGYFSATSPGGIIAGNASEMTLVVGFRMPSITNSQAYFLFDIGSDNSDHDHYGVFVFGDASNSGTLYCTQGGTDQIGSAAGVFVPNTNYVASVRLTGAAFGPTSVKLRINRANTAQVVTTGTGVPGVGVTNVALGSDVNGNSKFAGTIFAALVYGAALSDTEAGSSEDWINGLGLAAY